MEAAYRLSDRIEREEARTIIEIEMDGLIPSSILNSTKTKIVKASVVD
jgi:hypothetical protein